MIIVIRVKNVLKLHRVSTVLRTALANIQGTITVKETVTVRATVTAAAAAKKRLPYNTIEYHCYIS